MRQNKNNAGFTLVEIIIVVIIISVLASIVLITYNGIRQDAVVSTIKSDLKSAKSQLFTGYTRNHVFATTVDNLPASEGTTYEITTDNTTKPPSFCLTATNNNISYKVSDTTEPTEGLCPEHSGE